jgi:hypothetical protein
MMDSIKALVADHIAGQPMDPLDWIKRHRASVREGHEALAHLKRVSDAQPPEYIKKAITDVEDLLGITSIHTPLCRYRTSGDPALCDCGAAAKPV